MTENEGVELDFRFVSSLDPDEWLSRHLAGLVPDRVPYGLDRISDHGFRTRAARIRTPVRRTFGRLQATVKTTLDWSSVLQTRAGRPVLCWDERTGVPAASVPGPPVFTGIIWATELPRSRFIAGALRRAAGVFALSSAQLPVLEDWGVRDPAFVPMGVDPSFFRSASDERLHPPNLLTVGNDQHRDFNTVQEAHILLGARRPPLSILTRRNITVRAPRASLVPALSHRALAQRYADATVVIVGLHPNLHASGITTTLEAMACGRPVVVSDTPGMRDYIEDGSTGRLVPAGDPTAMAEAVADLMADPNEAALMGKRARVAVLANFTTEHLAQRLAEWMSARL